MDTCSVIMNDGKPCGLECYVRVHSNPVCIFHAPNKDNELFKTALLEKINKELHDAKVEVLDLSRFVFSGAIELAGLVINKSIILRGAHFSDNVSFSGCEFSGKLFDCSGIVLLAGTLSFNNLRIECEQILFAHSVFSGKEVSFNVNTKSENISFGGCRFETENTVFSVCNFSAKKNINFTSCVFKNSTSFSSTTFGGKSITFYQSKFQGSQLLFHKVEFETDIIDFGSIEFSSEESSFQQSVFNGSLTTFRESEFKSPKMSFVHNHFGSKHTLFEKSTVWGKLSFWGDRLSESLIPFQNHCSFRDMIFEGQGSMDFHETDLRFTELRGTNLRNIFFMDVEWTLPTKGKHKATRKFLYDEKLIRDGSVYKFIPNTCNKTPETPSQTTVELVRHAYRQLRQNFEAIGNYPEAGDFYYGEMEMQRRKLPRWRRYFFSWEWWYWVVSGYGQRWERSLGWIFFVLLAFPLLLLATGIPIELSTTEKSLHGFVQSLCYYGKALEYNIFSITYQRDFIDKLIPFKLSRLVILVESLLLPILGTLFVLALRRRFKR
jgi:uncharacterized protein YjbI with pentapeptide repeats